jgi:hypothetical protein
LSPKDRLAVRSSSKGFKDVIDRGEGNYEKHYKTCKHIYKKYNDMLYDIKDKKFDENDGLYKKTEN